MVRAAPGASVPQIRDRLRAINPRGVIGITRMADLVAIHQGPWKANLALFGIFAWLTVLLAVVGLYALLASTVVERSREIGVRLALGAGPRRIVALVLGDGARIALFGAGAGLLAAFAGGRLIRALLFETSPLDVVALAAAPIALVGVAITACAIPAFRAARVDPATSLRAEKAASGLGARCSGLGSGHGARDSVSARDSGLGARSGIGIRDAGQRFSAEAVCAALPVRAPWRPSARATDEVCSASDLREQLLPEACPFRVETPYQDARRSRCMSRVHPETECNAYVMRVRRRRRPALAFGDVGWNGHGRPSHLACQTV